MHSVPPSHYRSSTGRAIAFTLAVSVLLHLLVFISSGRLVAKPQISAPTLDKAQINIVLNRPVVHTAKPDAPQANLPQQTRPERGHKLRKLISALTRPDTPETNTAPLETSRVAPSAKPAHALSMSSLLQQVGELSTPAEPAQPSPGHLVYGSSAKGALWAQYMDDWVRKMERIGALNYPEEVRRQSLSGGPTLSVTLNADGSLRALRVTRSSGNPILDAAASNLVRSAAPFAPFPPALAQQARSLEIRRKWTFSTNNDLSVH